MRKLPKEYQPSVIFVLSLATLFLLVGYYAFFYIPAKRYELSQHYLRQVAMMSSQFENTLRNVSSIVSKDDEQEYSPKEVDDYLQYGLESLFSKEQIESDLHKEVTKNSEGAKDVSGMGNIRTVKLEELSFNPKGKIDLSVKIGEKQWTIGIKVEEFVKYVAMGDEFEDIVILDNEGLVVYQKGRYSRNGIESGLKIIKTEELTRTAIAPEDSKAGSPTESKSKKADFAEQKLYQNGVRSIEIGQVSYRVFTQPISPGIASLEKDNCWYLGGILSAKAFDQRCRRVSSNILLLFVFLVPLVFIGYPLLKMLLIGPKDRLRRHDLVFLILSFTFGIPALIYGIATVSERYLEDFRSYDDLDALSRSIQCRFQDEIRAAHKQLISLNDWLQKRSPTPTESSSGDDPKTFQDLMTGYIYADMVFAVDEEGKQLKKTVITQTPAGLKIQSLLPRPISNRDYYKKTKRKEFSYITYDKTDYPLVLDPVYSRSTGLSEINLAIPATGTPKIIAHVMSFRPLSVIKPVLPCHHGFAMIERTGRVVFHSDPRLNLIENFFAECDNPTRIQAALFADAVPNRVLPIEYQGIKRLLLVRPLEGIPWFLVVYKDRDVCGARSLATFIRAGRMYGGYFLFLASTLGVFLVLQLLQKKAVGSQDRDVYRRFRFLWPQEELTSEYSWLAVAAFVAFLILTIRPYLGKLPPALYFGWPCIMAIAAYGVILRFLKKSRSMEDLIPPIGLSIFWLGIVFLFSKIHFLFSKNDIYPSAGFLLILLISLWLAKFAPRTEKRKTERFTLHAYNGLVYTFFLLLFAFPALFCFKAAYDKERDVSVMFAQLNLARSYSSWRDWHRSTYPYADSWRLEAKPSPPFNPCLLQPYTIKSRKDVIPDAFTVDKVSELSDGWSAFSSAAILEFLGQLVPFGDPYLRFTGFLYGPESEGDIIDWKKKQDRKNAKFRLTYQEKYNLELKQNRSALEPIQITSTVPVDERLTEPGIWFLAVEIVLIMFLLSGGLYGVVAWLTRRITLKDQTVFSAETFLLQRWKGPIPGLVWILGPSSHWPRRRNGVVFITGPAIVSGRYQRSLKQAGVVMADLSAAAEDEKANLAKLKMLEDLVFGASRDINIFSRFEPFQYFRHPLAVPSDKKEGPSGERPAQDPAILARWERVLGQFEFRYAVETGPDIDLELEGQDPKIRALIDRECGSSRRPGADSVKPDQLYLQRLRPRLQDRIKSLGSGLDSATVKALIAELAKPVYDDIWRTSTIEEKSALLHLATHGLLNSKNRETIRNLLRRKLIKLNPPRLMNETFREYIRTAEDREVVLRWEKDTSDSHWIKIKQPLLFLGVGVVVFMLVSQPGLLQSWVGVAAAITGTIPGVLRVLDQLSSAWKKS